jgi:hypothetical protein
LAGSFGAYAPFVNLELLQVNVHGLFVGEIANNLAAPLCPREAR